MITIIHGDDYYSSRIYMLEERKKKTPNIIFEGKNLDLNTISQIADSDNLFMEKPAVFIENLFSGRNEKELESIAEFLKIKSYAIDLILWEDKEITKTNIEKFKDAKILYFKYQSSIFTFLDAIRPRNYANNISLYHQTLKNMPAEQIIHMLIRQFRLLLAVSDKENYDLIDEIKKLPIWQKAKIEKQSRLFGQDLLIKIYHKLFKLDYQNKTGVLEKPIAQAIDFLLLDI